MFKEEFESVSNAALAKVNLLKNNPLGYFLASMLAGAYIGFGIVLGFTTGALLSDTPYARIGIGLTFGVALSLVVMAGGELFTGNNLVMFAGFAKKKIEVKDGILLWVVCYLGNLAGSVLTAVIYNTSGLPTGVVGEFINTSALNKMNASAGALFSRAILCNILVCLAVWCGFKLKSESGKLIMIFWCIFTFITGGFEHSIANMVLFSQALLSPMNQSVTLVGMIYNLVLVTLGNMVGGIIFMGLPYYIISKDKQSK